MRPKSKNKISFIAELYGRVASCATRWSKSHYTMITHNILLSLYYGHIMELIPTHVYYIDTAVL